MLRLKKMKEEAEANASEDAKAKEEADKINGADALIFSTEKQLKEFGDKLSADKKAPIEAGLEKLKAAHGSRNFADIDAAQAELQNAWNAASEEMYKAGAEGQGDEQPQTQGDQPQDAGDNVTDVDFEEVKEDDKK
jgi:molecular chaperone DnaK